MPFIVKSMEELSASHTSWEMLAGHTELFVAFGGVPLKNTQVASGGAGEHRARGGLGSGRHRNLGERARGSDRPLGG